MAVNELVHLILTREEVDVLALGLARGVNPIARPKDASEASTVVWAAVMASDEDLGPIGSLATMLAEAFNPGPSQAPD